MIAIHSDFKAMTSENFFPHVRDTLLTDYMAPWEEDVFEPFEKYITEIFAPAYTANGQVNLLA